MTPRPILTTRRDFLRTTLLGSAFGWTVPSFVAETFSSLHAQADGALTQVATGRDNPILILIQLAGGNDGLNAVVPYTNDYYYKARPTLGIPATDVLKLNDTLGLNPALSGFKSLYDAGHFGVVNGVGYPNPNRSHFRATEIWQTATDAEKYATTGWLGRYFDNACPGADPTVGINIGPRLPQAFSSDKISGISLESPNAYRFMGAKANDDEELAYRGMFTSSQGEPAGSEANTGSSISMVSGTMTVGSGKGALDFLERTSMDAEVSSDKIRAIAGKVKNQAVYPHSGLANDLALVARLIAGGLSTRVFYVSQGGYDTHFQQRGAQDLRLKELGDSVKAFTDDLTAMGHFDRVMIMTFSEFGRRVVENGSKGTDHGAAAPMFLVGSKIKAGVIGTEPSLAPADLLDGDIQYKTDFRSVYASFLQNWLKTSSVPILGRQFDTLPLIV
jgi:uncharacterized protein (DUF1501 family)